MRNGYWTEILELWMRMKSILYVWLMCSWLHRQKIHRQLEIEAADTQILVPWMRMKSVSD